MLNNLRQGTNVYVLEKTNDGLFLKEGKIVNILPSMGGIDINVNVDDVNYEFKQVPYGQSVARYGNVIVSETKEGILSEITKLKEISEGIINQDNIAYHTKLVKECDLLMRQLNPIYDKEQKRDEEIDLLKKQMSVMSDSLANIEKLLSNKNN